MGMNCRNDAKFVFPCLAVLQLCMVHGEQLAVFTTIRVLCGLALVL